ncbi:hypothetical protein MIB92_17030 [Aestuariirhabdus sp. Z084]|uniref:hypothetical protein n=1 Tax=Aestuariirhabdus haliotis TaxID=2918751 RepID=UPI00201B3EB2|nr:hypothetical protein [Aestuariirhabdus haliotis]MCL6417366.1 hypothetical protein [Aestuariirhabdus haliotis]MCL6421311.1 hypothetical protein [Aestuariirhabdus haliotis]
MRLLFALVYIGFGMWAYFALGGDSFHPIIGSIVGFGLLFSSVFVCNEGFLRRIKGQSDKDYINELLGLGKAKKESYTVIEAITFEDLSTSCLCHFLDVGSNSVLCLHGQYLYDFVEIIDDPDINQERVFPTRKFKLVREVKNDEVLDLIVGEDVVSEIRVEYAGSILEKLYDLGIEIRDGELINHIKFAEIKSICMQDG